MNIQMIFGLIRHAFTVGAGIFLAASTPGGSTLEGAIQNLFKNIAAGDVNAIIATSLIIVSLLWSMWTKMQEESKKKVIKALTFKK